MINPYLKIPCELAQFSIREKRVREAQIYLSGLYLYSGKARLSEQPLDVIGSFCSVKKSTVYNKVNWLLQRDWIGKDKKNGWLFFRGLNRVHQLEGWQYSRSAVMFENDLHSVKAFFIGAVLSNIVYSGNTGSGTDRKSRRSKQTRYPVSLSLIRKVLNVSEKTAYNYRKLAQKYRYIKMTPNLQQVADLSAKDIPLMKQNGITSVDVRLFGTSESLSIHPKQLRTDNGFVYAQLANFIYPKVQIKKRNLSRSQLPPLRGIVSKKLEKQNLATFNKSEQV